jgi:hypothetical protein
MTQGVVLLRDRYFEDADVCLLTNVHQGIVRCNQITPYMHAMTLLKMRAFDDESSPPAYIHACLTLDERR